MKDLTNGKESKLIMQFATPMILGSVFYQLYNVVDSVIVGNFIGKEALAAVGASFPVLFALISLIFGIGSGFTIIISQYFGAKDIKSVKKTIDTMYIFLFFASIIITILGITFSEDIFRLIKLPEDVLPQAKIYLNIFLTGIVFFFGFNGTNSVLRGLGDSKTPLYFLIASTIMNIILDLLFVIVFKMGIAGAAFATVVSQALVFVALIMYLNKFHKVIHFSIAKITFDKKIFKKSIRIGLPSGIQQTLVGIGMMALMGIVSKFGTNAIAAYTVASRLEAFTKIPVMNFSMALSTFVGQNLGANKFERVKKGFKSTLIMSGLICIILAILIIPFRHFLIGIFTNDNEVINIGATYLIIVTPFYLLFSIMFSTNGVLRGAGATLIPMFTTLIALWVVRIPLAYYLSSFMGIVGIWWSIPVAWTIGMTGALIYYSTGKWKNKVVVRVKN